MNRLRNIIAVAGLLCCCSCDRGPFAEHEVKLEKVTDDCRQRQTYFRLISNIAGERYEFEKCLPVDYNSKYVTSERKGDTVVVRFTQADTSAKAVYHVILDIDSYPPYNVIRIDDESFNIRFSEN